jgi:uncharacterized protein (TIGR02246 family)
MVRRDHNIANRKMEKAMERGIRSTGIRTLMLVLLLGALSPALQAAELTAADYTAIQQLYARYNTTLDRGDAEGWAATFTPDGVFATNFKGTEALKGFANTWRTNPAMNGAARRHFSADLVITAGAQDVTASVSTLLVDLSTTPVSIASYVTYSDVLVKTAAGWRFKSRAVKAETASAAPAAK